MRSFFVAIILLAAASSQAQVGIGTTSPNGAAQLDITSTTKGLLIPRMTSAQRLAIATPVAGLLVYDTDNARLMQYNGSTWLSYVYPSDLKVSGLSNLVTQQVIEMDNIQVRTRAGGTTGFEFKAKTGSFVASWSAETTFLNTTGSNNTAASMAAQHSQSITINTGTWNLFYSGTWTIHPASIRTLLFDETNLRFYRITCFVTAAYTNNQVVIERLN